MHSVPSGEDSPSTSDPVGRALRVARALIPLVVAVYLVRFALEVQAAGGQDFLVYKHAGVDVAAGRDPYELREALPYTYPPALGLLFAACARVPDQVAIAAFLALNVALAFWLVHRLLITRPPGADQPGTGAPGAPDRHEVLLLGAILLCSAPFGRSIALGQFNLVLFALLAWDHLWPGRTAGVWTGVAAAIKVTPMAMVLSHVAERRWRAAVLTVGAFLAVGVITFVAARESFVTYWGHLLWDSSRVGGLGYADNQSLTGLLARLAGESSPPRLSVLALLVPVIAVTFTAAWWGGRGPDRWIAPMSIGLFGLFFSPVSWSHHWFWLPVFIVWRWHRGHRTEALWLALVLAVEPLLLVGPSNGWPAPLAGLVTSTYTLVGFYAAIRLLMVARALTHGRGRALARRSRCGTAEAGGVPRG
ncbi:MAG: glycosyltransferase 87 family protein [Dermatophilaceae bacterium]